MRPFWQLVTSNLESLTTIQPEFLPLYTQLEYEMNRPLLARLWRSKSPVNYTMYLAQSLGEYMDHCSSKMNVMLLSASSDHPPIPFWENPLYQSPSRGPHWMVTVGTVKYYSCLNDLTYCLKLRSLLQVILFTFPFYVVRDYCFHSTPRSEHWRQWSSGFHAVAEISTQSYRSSTCTITNKVKQTPFRTCAVFILSTPLGLGNNQCN